MNRSWQFKKEKEKDKTAEEVLLPIGEQFRTEN